MATRLLPFTLFSSSKPQVPLATLSHVLFGGHHGRFSTQVEKIRWNHVGESSNRNLIYRFRTFCASRDLAAKKCVPCNSKDLQAMTEESATEFLLKVAGWNLVNENGTLKLNRSWKVKSFTKGLELFQLVGNVAETEGHHPDLHLVGWNNITIEIWTHAVGGLTENDFILAAKINGLNLHPLLRKNASA
ncbi:pterin-4-alpha-carbinolamine dehydratase 2 [Populus alba x Populus x berolinensis]|uniref:4a-hydroxytetrahydrobiopterin dehydratase n=1 Tax=Populus davidiana TaxID=266767 RepID=A0A6M2EVC8_9ROSI|nr:pterin-4-alpha-carbinolamine dehydratase 2 [Populus alba x Populus x berolinensis]KAJ6965823.1 pterin-4-alpha-carbinolamine dehydratase 2 [Populus alba x Populus x berolinensis]